MEVIGTITKWNNEFWCVFLGCTYSFFMMPYLFGDSWDKFYLDSDMNVLVLFFTTLLEGCAVVIACNKVTLWWLLSQLRCSARRYLQPVKLKASALMRVVCWVFLAVCALLVFVIIVCFVMVGVLTLLMPSSHALDDIVDSNVIELPDLNRSSSEYFENARISLMDPETNATFGMAREFRRYIGESVMIQCQYNGFWLFGHKPGRSILRRMWTFNGNPLANLERYSFSFGLNDWKEDEYFEQYRSAVVHSCSELKGEAHAQTLTSQDNWKQLEKAYFLLFSVTLRVNFVFHIEDIHAGDFGTYKCIADSSVLHEHFKRVYTRRKEAAVAYEQPALKHNPCFPIYVMGCILSQRVV
jgi:hypothetical protein